MQKSLILIFILSIFLFSCGKEEKPFLIKKQNIGNLNDSSQVKDLKTIFAKDSVANYIGTNEFTRNINNIEIYDDKGTALLIVSPKRRMDSTSVINAVRILDSRYKTEKGISTLSRFKDINDNYKISKIDNLINSVVITVPEINAAFTIDKKELPSNLRFNRTITIEASQIPDDAKIKYFFIHWN